MFKRNFTPMRLAHDPSSDTLTVILKDRASIAESDEKKPGIVLDYDRHGDLVSFEIIDASKRVMDTRVIEFSVSE